MRTVFLMGIAVRRYWGGMEAGPSLIANSLCPRKEKRTMRGEDNEIDNSGPDIVEIILS
jgi:hypothetical protein